MLRIKLQLIQCVGEGLVAARDIQYLGHDYVHVASILALNQACAHFQQFIWNFQ